ncbi:MAG: metal ABC transporter substrate-binding protein [Elusimicrobia bacterium]|nr:metal ABC transporter substrate-binding protein [Elusimicrobiota bacterium]
MENVMNKSRLALAALLLALAARPAAAKLRVVATIPDLADVSRRVGGGLVSVDCLARGPEDIHQVVMRPSFVSKLNRADAVVYLGLSVEHSFLPGLLDAAANPRMREDPAVLGCAGPGCIDCSAGVRVLQKPDSLSRAEGELHPQGNPHYNLDPEDGLLIARNIAAGFSRLDPAHAADYERNLAAFLDELKTRIAEWKKAVAPLQGLKAVSYHKDVAYLGRFTGLDFIDTIELKPGVAPTPTHLARLVREMQDQGVKLIVREQQYESRTTAWLAGRTGAKVAVIGTMADALPGTETYVKFCARNIQALLDAAR